MKKLLLSGLAFLIITQLNAQNYQVTFTATGASTTVTTVTVENLTSRTSITLNGTDILNLTITTGINSPEYNQSSDLKIYPNPMNDYTTLEVFPPFEGNASIVISEMTGKPVARKQVYLEKNGEGFKLSGLKSGFYFVNIIGNGFQFSGKLVSNGNATGNINIENAGRIIQTIEKKEVTKGNKGLEATVDMAYTTGDRLKFTGTSGNYKTIITDVPASNKTINFNFVACRDADFNIYPVVAIGTQVWMAENLKTTKYNDGTTAITNVTDNTTWAGLPTGAYCDYSNTPTYSVTYGRLYNWYAVASTNPKNVCPTGWHVATDPEWTALETYLGGAAVTGEKLKETGTTHWSSPNTATNETGFTALPGGYRSESGPFGLMGSNGYWWTSTEATPSSGFYRNMINISGNLVSADKNKHAGLYVRCVKD